MRALYDPGASRTVMGPIGLQLASACGRALTPSQGRGARVADGCSSPISGYVELPFEVAGIKKDLKVAVMPELDADCYLGVNFVREFQAILDPCSNQLLIKPAKRLVELELASVTEPGVTALSALGLADVTSEERQRLQQLLDFKLGAEPATLGCTDWVVYEIDVGDARPIKQRCYPYSPKVKEDLYSQVREMLESGVIEPSSSGWSSPVVMVKKANGKYRFCIDFRKVNAVSTADAYPLPRMDSILRKLQKARYISTLDLSSAYHQIPLKESSRPVTALTVPGMGLFHFKRLPYGMSTAGASFQRLIDMVIGPELEPHAFSYLDDVIIVSETFEEHMRWLEHVLDRIRQAGLTINREKSVFCQGEAKYLGVIVNRDGFRPDPAKIEPVLNFPAPKNLRQLRRFLGMASWYRRFLKNLAALSEPLSRLTNKGRKYEWGEEQQEAFEKIKALLASAPMIQSPRFDEQFVIQTDASDTGIGAVLFQIIDGAERVLEFASRILTSAERNYSVTERECLAVVWAIKKFRAYVEGYEFKVITDHSSLKWLCNLHNPTGLLARWALELQGYRFIVEHKKGALNHVPDALSRMYEEDEGEGPSIASIAWAVSTKDEWYLRLLREVTEDPTRYPRFKVIGGQLYSYNPDPLVQEVLGDDDAWKIVVPSENRKEVLQECHDDPTSGHLGREKTLARAALRYFWPKMEAYVTQYVRQCQICQQCKPEQRAPAGLMGHRVVERPWQVVAGDIMGPLCKSRRGYEYVLVFQDLFTRWVECVPLRKVKGEAVLKELVERVFLRYGTPEVFLSDNGTEFKNRVIDEYLAKKGVHHTTIPPYYPRANPVERVNRTLKTMIVSFVEESHQRWDEHLHELVFAYNTAKQSSTRLSPALLNYGRQPPPLSSAYREQLITTAEEQQDEAVKRWAERVQNITKLHKHASEKSRQEHERHAKYYNAQHLKV